MSLLHLLLSLDFARPQRLMALLIIPILGLLYLLMARKQHGGAVSRELQLVVPKDAAWKRHGAVLLAFLSLTALIVAWALPQGYSREPRDRATIIVAIDVSWSMEATDVAPSRLEAAQQSAKQFVNSLPQRFNVGLVTFAGTANLAVPPTRDKGAVNRAIDAIKLAPSTATGEAIYMSLQALKLVPPDPAHPDSPPPASIVLLGDGATNLGRSSYGAAKTAKELNVPVFTIAYGTPHGTVVDNNGDTQTVAVDHFELKQIADVSGGKKFSAESVSELKEIYAAIQQEVGYERVPTEITDQYAGYALFFAILAALGVISLGARWP